MPAVRVVKEIEEIGPAQLTMAFPPPPDEVAMVVPSHVRVVVGEVVASVTEVGAMLKFVVVSNGLCPQM